jgi:two-component system, chemotaxis family, sensor kinase Cph1
MGEMNTDLRNPVSWRYRVCVAFVYEIGRLCPALREGATSRRSQIAEKRSVKIFKFCVTFLRDMTLNCIILQVKERASLLASHQANMSQSADIIAQVGNFPVHDQLIHAPGSIQAHGVLIALGEPGFKILQVSNNTQQYLGKNPQDLLNQPLSKLIDTGQIDAIRRCLVEGGGIVNSLKLVIPTVDGEKFFDAIVHPIETGVILELEPIDSQCQMNFLDFYTLLRGAIAKIQRMANLRDFLHSAALEVKKITGFDRVMVYKFNEVNAGAVIAEAKDENLSPYLGLHFPATDIPEPARELYKLCPLRLIPDFNVPVVELVPVNNPVTNQPLDLSLSVLRSFSSCCSEYHQNMGSAAILVIPLLQGQHLWGLISCHHQTPKHIPWQLLKICEFLGQILGLELAHKITQEEFDHRTKLQSLQAEFIESISQADNFIDALTKPEISLLDLVNASGAAICLSDEITLLGVTPNTEEVRGLLEWADAQVKDSLFSSDSLPKLYSQANAFKDTATGLLLLRISRVRRYYMLWFRPEVIQTINWAGDPKEGIKLEPDGSLVLCPRTSFAQWQETVRLTSLPWLKSELDSAIALRNAVVGIVLSKADELAKINLELERSNRELASFAYAASHDLKEPLRGIYNYSAVLIEDYRDVLNRDGMEYLETILTLSVRMETLIDGLLRLSQLGQAEVHLQETNLNGLLKRVIEVFRASRQDNHLDIRIPRILPMVNCDPVLINEVFSNLITNGFKYNDRVERWVEIGYLDEEEQSLCPVFYVRDNGIGIREQHREIIFRLFKRLHSQEKYGGGAGVGLAITKKIIERHAGRIWVESNYKEGSTIYFTIESMNNSFQS